LGSFIAKDKASYEYLAESIKTHPSQTEILELMNKSGFINNKYNNLLFGVVAIHRGYKI
jgi:demethylmenaquinone methyltransferase/2-methoxy-6-polyprenyl-1,4-benzoquinol methylase